MKKGTKKVYIINSNSQYISMFIGRGWEVVDKMEDADLVQFTGGSDVSPHLYNEEEHPSTQVDIIRDAQERGLFEVAKALHKPVAGICRGGQFLNVMCGGSLFQNVNNHALFGTHVMINVRTGGMMPVTSTHHQMMRPGEGAKLLAVASEATVCESVLGERVCYHKQARGEDVEVLYYPEHNALCFQPHPEYMEQISECQDFYFQLIQEKL